MPLPPCPNCAGPMSVSHTFYAVEGGPRLQHLVCQGCHVGLTQTDNQENEEEVNEEERT